MTTDLSQYNANELPNADVLARQRYAIVVADWNSEITHKLAQGAIDTLVKHGVKEENIDVTHVPGTVELTYGAALYVSGRKGGGALAGVWFQCRYRNRMCYQG
jgi:6,7-dimethyl-8-ribityllumazine synthase